MPVIGVLALQGDVREHVRALGEAGATARPVRRLQEIESVDGLVIPGGESTTLWKLATAFELMDPIRKLIACGMPAFGSCAGLIMLADRLRGRRGRPADLRRHRHDRAPQRLRPSGGLLRAGGHAPPGRRGQRLGADEPDAGDRGAAPFHAVFIRAPMVERAGERVTVLGADNGRIVAVRQGPLLATAFHPELTPDRRIHELFVKMVKGTS